MYEMTKMEREYHKEIVDYGTLRLNKVRSRFPTFRVDSPYVKPCRWLGHHSELIVNGGLSDTDDIWICLKCGMVWEIFGGYNAAATYRVGYIDQNVESYIDDSN